MSEKENKQEQIDKAEVKAEMSEVTLGETAVTEFRAQASVDIGVGGDMANTKGGDVAGGEAGKNTAGGVTAGETAAADGAGVGNAGAASEPKKVKKTEKNTMKKDEPKLAKTLKLGKDAKKFAGRERSKAPASRREESEFDKKLVDVRRVAKVVTGGRTLRFSALVVVGNKKGQVGIGIGKAAEVPEAIEKATDKAKRSLIEVPIAGRTIPHEVTGHHGSSKVIMMPSKEGNGVIAGGAARAVLELSGIKDITAKIHGSSNKINCVRATIKGLNALRTKEQIAALRGKTAEEI